VAKPGRIEPDWILQSRKDWNTADMFPRGRKAEDGIIDDRYNLIELSTSSYPTRTKRNIEESDGIVIFSLERLLSGGTRLTLYHANKVGMSALHIYDTRKDVISNPDSLRPEVETLTDFLRSPSGIEGARRLRVDAKYVALLL
jgi:Circularly permutated YpsA SLOG family